MNLFNRKQRTTQTNALDILKTKMQIEVLKERLAESDYQVIKCYEFALTGKDLPYDVSALNKERQAIRDRINELQAGE